MGRSRVLIAIAAVVALLVVPVGAVAAECASPPSLDVALTDASVAFIGEITEARFDSEEASVNVLWIWKGGDLPKEVVVRTPSDSNVSFRVGGTYIVIPQNVKAPFELDSCSATRMYRASGETIPDDLQVAVGSAVGRAPGAEIGGNSNDSTKAMGVLLISVSIGLVVLVAIGGYRYRSRSGEPLSDTGTVSGGKQGRWRRVGGPLSWSARSGHRQIHRMRRGAKRRRRDSPD